MRLRLQLVLGMSAAIAALGLAGCGSGGGSAAPDSSLAGTCANETRADPYSAGMMKVGSAGYTFTLTSAEPAPPQKGNNDWHITIDDPSGNPVDNAALGVRPWMPDHGHGSSIVAKVTFEKNGQYDVSPVNLWMPGYWETTITLKDSSGNTLDAVKFKFCISG